MTIGEAVAAIERDAHEPDKTLANALSLRAAISELANRDLDGQELWNALYVPPREVQTVRRVRGRRLVEEPLPVSPSRVAHSRS